MKKEERDYLKDLKYSDGIDYDEAMEEIQELENSQKHFKVLNRELKKKDTKIRNLEKQVEKLKERILKIEQKKIGIKINITKKSNLGKDILEKDMIKADEEKIRRWKTFANRVERNMPKGASYTKSDMQKTFMLPSYASNWVINSLIRKGIIDSKETKMGTRYFKK